jgi:hypothetical protein
MLHPRTARPRRRSPSFSALRWCATRARLIGAGAFNALPTSCPIRTIGWQRPGVVEAGRVRVAVGRKWLRWATSEWLGEGSGRDEPRSSGYGLLGHPKPVIPWRRPRRGAPGYLSPIVMFMYPRTRMTCSTQKSRAREYFVIVIIFFGFFLWTFCVILNSDLCYFCAIAAAQIS